WIFVYLDNAGNKLPDIKLEKGSTATPYTPAPEDVEDNIQSVNNFDIISQKATVDGESAIDGIEVGGRNLVLDSYSLEMTGSDNGNRNVTTFEDGVHVITPTNNGNIYNTQVQPSMELVKGNDYTLSFDVSTNKAIGVYWYAKSGGSQYSGGSIPNTEGEWIKHEFTYTQTRNSFNGKFLFGFHNLVAGSEVKYKNLKLEKGNIATDWTPAPEDNPYDTLENNLYKTNILLSEPLRSVGDVKDRLFRDSDGLWKIERNVAEGYADGSENWVYKSSYGRFDASTSF